MKKFSLLFLVSLSTAVFGQTNDTTTEKTKLNFFGGLESNSQWYTNDKEREINHPEDPFRSNSYLNLNLNLKGPCIRPLNNSFVYLSII